MSASLKSALDYSRLNDEQLMAELGKAVRQERLGILPEEEDRGADDSVVGRSFFERQLQNLRRIYCTEAIANHVKVEAKRDVVTFVASLIDLFATYFGQVAATIILVQIYKIGVDRFCIETAPKP